MAVRACGEGEDEGLLVCLPTSSPECSSRTWLSFPNSKKREIFSTVREKLEWIFILKKWGF
jgi:hypothetical protein